MLRNILPFLFASTLLLPSEILATEPSKIALLIAVGNYPKATGWQPISSLHDLTIIREALLKQGFREEEIFVVSDEAATKEGILEAIHLHLEGKAQAGGTAYFHFSGHGQQVADDDGDESDGYDEAIVPVDSPRDFQAGIYEGERLIRDDELGVSFKKVRRLLGPDGSLTVVLDACHSGTGTRGFGVARGTQNKMASDAYVASNSSRGKGNASLDGFNEQDESSLAPFIAFFGAAQNQLNFETTDEEGRSVGSLSYAFSKKFTLATPNTTYRGLFEQIRLEMSAIAPRQQPQVEGLLDRKILGGNLVGAPSFFRVKQWNDPGSIVLETGWLQGIHEGSVIGFFPPETRNVSDHLPLAKGTVNAAGATTCTVALDADLDQQTALGAWAFVLEQSFGNLQLSVKVALEDEHPLRSALEHRLEKLPILRQKSSPELIVTNAASEGVPLENASRGAAVQLMTSSDVVLETFPENLRPEILAERIVRQMMAYGQARFLKNLELTSSQLPVEFELIPVNYDRQKKSVIAELPLSGKRDDSGTVHFKNGDVVKIKVTNQGYKPAYFTLLDIQPDNKINVLIPNAEETPAEFLVPPGQSIEVKRLFEFGPPAGTEVFKLIATDKPIDLRPIAGSRGEGTKSNSAGFERLFSQTFYNDDCMSRGGKAVSVSVMEVSVASFSFIIE